MRKILIFVAFLVVIVFVVRICYSTGGGGTHKKGEPITNKDSSNRNYESKDLSNPSEDEADIKGESLINENNAPVAPVSHDQGKARSQQKMNIYMMYNRYSSQTREKLRKLGVEPFMLIASSAIDPKKTNKFDSVSVRIFLDKYFPEKSHTGIFIIDWEKELYDWLKLPQTDERFVIAQNEYIGLVHFIRKLRPNLKIGIYGLPFRVYADKTRNINGPGFKFQKVLSVCDFVAPSFYFMNLDEEIGRKQHDLIFRNNIEIALEYGELLDKPVVPFIWELVHHNNKRFSNELIPLNEFIEKMDLIKSVNVNGRSINAVLWWTPSKLPTKYTNFSKSKSSNLVDVRDSISLNYLNRLIIR